jgi:ribosomal protein S18 acetylase RimI-like enzyme
MIINNDILLEDSKTYIMPDIYLRPATKKDIPLMIQWELESISVHLRTQKRIIKLITEDCRRSVPDTQMIMYKDSTIGMLTCCYIDDGEWWYIGEIYIVEEHRGKGIGTILLNRMIKYHNKIKLQVDKDNIRAQKLYKSLGFTISGENEYMYVMSLVK